MIKRNKQAGGTRTEPDKFGRTRRKKGSAWRNEAALGFNVSWAPRRFGFEWKLFMGSSAGFIHV